MSRSRKKYAVLGIACGCNTSFYREANRKLRTIKNRTLKNLQLGKIDEDSLHFPTKHKDIGYNDWTEPTDGHYRKGEKNFPYWMLDKLKRK